MIRLDGFIVQKQKTHFTCGYSTLSMVTSYLGKKVDEETILREFPLGYLGATPSKVIKAFEKYIADYRMKYLVRSKDSVLNIVDAQLKNGIPIPFLYLTVNDFDKPNLVSHYSIIIGIDKEQGKVVIANPFGYEEIIEVDELLRKMAFKIKGKMPFILKLSILLKIMKGYMIFEIRKVE